MSEYGALTEPGAIRIERLLPGPVERIWAYLTESDKRGSWLASGPMSLSVGGGVENVFNNCRLTGHDGAPPPKYARHAEEIALHGVVTACEPLRLLSYSWAGAPGESSEVTFTLQPKGERVLLQVVHRRLSGRHETISVAAGWHAHLNILADRLSGREPKGFWPEHTRLEVEYEKLIPEHESEKWSRVSRKTHVQTNR